MSKIVFFDLDGTILKGLSSENAFIITLMKRRVIWVKQYLWTLLFIICYFHAYGKYVFIKDKAYLTDLPIDKVNQLAKDFVNKKLLKKIRPRLKERIEIHRKRGDHLVLLTGSPKFIADIIANYLKIGEVCATICSTNRDRFSHLPPVQHPFAEEKLIIAQEVCDRCGINIADCVAYGNSINDRLILEAVGYAVAVEPDRKLRRIAQSSGWEIVAR